MSTQGVKRVFSKTDRNLSYYCYRLGKAIREARSRNRTTADQVAKASEIHRVRLSRIEHGELCPTVIELYRLMHVTGAGFGELFPTSFKQLQTWANEEKQLVKAERRRRLEEQIKDLDEMD